MSLIFRPARPDMLDELVELDVRVWGEEMAAARHMLERRMEVNPSGNYVAIHRESGQIAGSVWTLWLNEGMSYKTWFEATGEGEYKGVFDPFGEVLFGTNISADRSVTATDAIGPFLLAHVAELVPTMGRKFARMGGRMPGYHRWSKLFTPQDYICLCKSKGWMYFRDPAFGFYYKGPLISGLLAAADSAESQIEPGRWPVNEQPEDAEPLDFELAFFTAVPVRGQPFKIVKLLPDYFQDSLSHDNGVLLEWANPDLAG